MDEIRRSAQVKTFPEDPAILTPVRVLIVDDSSMTRFLMQEIFDADPAIEVVGAAADAMEARRLIKVLKPDVLTLDVEMPGMSGIAFLRNLMRLRPMPVVMVSSLTERGADTTLQALAIGAVDFVTKPRVALDSDSLADYAAELTTKVKVASTARISALADRERRAPAATRRDAGIVRKAAQAGSCRQVVAIGASTGGTEAIAKVLAEMPADDYGVVIVQHIADAFNAAFTRRLDQQADLRVTNAVHGDPVERGCAYVAPAGMHLALRRNGPGYQCVLSDEEAVGFHRPSVDVLFHSVASQAGSDAVGIILTGMGCDGAEGLAAMRGAGAYTIAQNEQSSVVWGMPGTAIRMGGAVEVAALDSIAGLVRRHFADS